ncbi:BTAD domain-containing putative transcriptional regulator [Streptomyces sp. NEAU-L66]|uniref:BTAD domain-containing putative transcriptional regulator n=1 Tax=Streptomyces sp. NEAU-L66 TaxID=3390812 RepID=UPI0039C6B41F
MTYHSALRERLTAGLTVLSTLSFTLALLAGMPYVLWWATGVPWPDRISSWHELGERLAEPISDPLVIDLLALVGWVCWAAFACTVIREICWYTAHLPQLLHDRRTHKDHLATLPVKGSLAALCIGTLVVALLSLWRPSTASAQQPTSAHTVRPPIALTAPLNPSTGQKTTGRMPAAPGPAKPATGAFHPGHAERDADAAVVQHVEYAVREGDTLWDIARTHLGDALKWPRIYALNKDRVQPDGDQLTDPDLLKPGWRLTIPVSHRPTSPPAGSQTPSAQPAPTGPTLDPNAAAGQQVDRPHAAPRPRQDSHVADRTREKGPAALGFGEASLIGITAAAGLLAARRYWYLHQRRLRRPGDDAPVPALSPLVDKAAQAAHAATQSRRPHDPEPLVTRRTPPQQPRSADTVTIGVDANTEVPLDALATAGGCTWTGPGAEDAARALLTGLLTAAERQRPGPPRLRAVVPEELAARLLPGLPPQFTALTQTTDTAHAVREAEHHLIAHVRAQHEHDTSATAPATADSAGETDLGTLLLLTTPEPAHLGQVHAMAARSRPGILTVLTLDTLLPDAEHWHIATDGTTTRPGAHPQHAGLKLFRLTPDAGHDMTQVLLGAHGQRPNLRILPAQSPPPHDKQPETAAAPEPEEEAEPRGPHLANTSRPTQAKPVRLHVLGSITLFARGHDDPVGTSLRPEVHEFLALLAAHPTGLLVTDIADKLQLEPDTAQNALKNLRRAVRRALRAATGITAQEFILRQGELHKLHPELVETDLADFTRALQQAFSANRAQESEKEALPAVREALNHYRGPFAQSGDYLWADAIREHLTTQATDAALRLAHQAEHTAAGPHQRDAVLPLLERLGAIHPDHERLVQHTIRLYQAAGRHGAARHTYARLERHLAELGLEPDPATHALLTPRTPHRSR